MQTSHLAEKGSNPIGLRLAARVTGIALLLSLAALQSQALASGGLVAPRYRSEIKITATLGAAQQGQTFQGKIKAVGGARYYTFAVIKGALPAGLSLQPVTGLIAGTPQKAETSNFTVRALSANRMNYSDLGLRLTVAGTVSHTTVTVTPTTATVTSAGTQQLTATVTSGGGGGGTTTLVADAPLTSSTTATSAATTSTIRWSTTSGTISTSGLFTAPATTVPLSATVTATSTVDPTAFASSVISVTPSGSNALSISTNGLPIGTQGSSYSDSLAATGGSLPYTWSLTSGSLPAGVSLNAAGTLSGTPSKTGTFSFSVKVSDAASHSATASLGLTVDAQGSGQFDGPAELPRVYVQSALANTPANGKTWAVTDSASLQSALNASACGDTISLQAGTTFGGTFSFPQKSCDDQHWIIVRTSAPNSSLPAEGTRMTPCYAGVVSLPGRPSFHCTSTSNVMAKLVYTVTSGSGPVVFLAGANHYRLIGLEITRAANAVFVGNLAFPIKGAVVDHIIFDRVWMHGTTHDDTTRAFYLSGISYFALVDSYLNDFHCESALGSCTDSQDISGGLGDTQDNAIKIVNNFLEASAESIEFGGGRATTTPADIEVRQNHFFKPLIWMKGQPGFIGGNHGNAFIVKNHFELKNAQRVLFEGNVSENAWGGFSQAGFTLLLTPKNQHTPNGSVCPVCQVTDITVRFSKFSHTGSGFQIANAADKGGLYALAGQRYSFHDLILEDVNATVYGGQGQLAQVSAGPTAPILADVQFSHVTAFPSSMLFDIGNDVSNPKMPNFMFANSIVTTGASPIWSTGGNQSNCSYTDIPTTTMTNCFANYTFGSNALIAVPSRYPPSLWPAGNSFMLDPNAIGFVNFNNGNGGDYHLQPTSKCKNAGSDGKDLGADVNAVISATANAY